jgi:hypothetical protein
LLVAALTSCGGGSGGNPITTPAASGTTTPVTPVTPVVPVTPVTPSGSISFAALHSSADAEVVSAASVLYAVKSADVAATTATTATVFNFGNIPSTEAYLFQIENTGTAVVNNVTVTADNPAVIVTPSEIAILPLQGTGSIVPITQVQVIHGVGANGHGTAALLPQGAFVCHLTATGTDASGNTVTSTCELDMNALVAKFEIDDYAGVNVMVASSNQRAASLNSANPICPGTELNIYPSSGWYWLTTDAPAFSSFTSANANYTIKNLGNTPLTVTDFGNQYTLLASYTATANSYTIQPGAVQVVNFTYDPTTANFLSDSGYAILDPIVINSGDVVFNSVYPCDTSGSFFLAYNWVQPQ